MGGGGRGAEQKVFLVRRPQRPAPPDVLSVVVGDEPRPELEPGDETPRRDEATQYPRRDRVPADPGRRVAAGVTAGTFLAFSEEERGHVWLGACHAHLVMRNGGGRGGGEAG